MNIITRRPMNRADWAWVMAAVVFGIFFATLGILPEVFDGGPRQVEQYDFATGKWNESVEAPNRWRVTIETSGDMQKIMQAAHDIDPNSSVLPSADHPKLGFDEGIQIFCGGVFGMVMISLLFRIVVKICGRFLGATTDEVDPVRDTSPSSGGIKK